MTLGATRRGFIRGLSVMSLGLALSLRADEPMGVTYETGATTFRVWAPNASSVAVIGDYNGWNARQLDQLTVDPGTGIWSGLLRGSRPRGAYQFLVNDRLARRDPYGRAVSTDEKKSLFYDPSEFKWDQHASPHIALEDLIIYEMHIGSFHDPKPADGMPATFDDAIRRLDYLVQLGVNTLCVLPVHEFAGNHSWGYNPTDLFAVEQAYGGPDGLKRFVQACHARGLAVHLDIVHNHYGPDNLDLLQFDGTGNPSNGGIYFYEGHGIAMTPWGPRVRFDEPMVRRFIRDNAVMWLEEYRVDGFRWDSTVNIRAYNDGANPIPAGAQMLEDINREIKDGFHGRWSIAEDSLGIGNFHASWDYDFHHQVMPVLSAPQDAERNVHQVASALRSVGRMWRVVYVDNHDEAGKLNRQQRIASDIDPAEPGSDYVRRMCGLGAVLTFTAPGIPLLFMGNEFQEHGTWHENTPLDWSKTRKHVGMLNLHRDLIALRSNRGGHSIGLKGTGVRTPLLDNDSKHIVYWRWHDQHPADQAVVVINFTRNPSDIVIPFPSQGPWIMRLNSDWTTYGGQTSPDTARPFTLPPGGKARTTLAPYSARIFTLMDRPATGAAIEPPSRPTGRTDVHERLFSIWKAINLSGDFNDWSLTDQSFELVENGIWQGQFVFRDVANPQFRIVANHTDFHWGSRDGKAITDLPSSPVLTRLGRDVKAEGVWSGVYQFRFNEQSLRLDIDRTGEVPQEPPDPPAAPEPAAAETVRSWTDVRGAVVEARLIRADESTVTLQRADGREFRTPIERLSAPDREYVQRWIRANR